MNSLSAILTKWVKREASESRHIPFMRHVNPWVLKTFDGHYLFVLKVQGISHQTETDEILDIRADNRNTLLNSFDGKNVSLYSHTFRKRVRVENKSEFDNQFLKHLDKAYNYKFKRKDFFVNEMYLTLVRINDDSLKGLKKIVPLNEPEISRKDELMVVELKEYLKKLQSHLKDYRVSIMKTYRKEGLLYSKPLEVFSYIINRVQRPVLLPEGPINNYLPISRKIFSFDRIEIQHGVKREYSALLSIKNYCKQTIAGMLDILSSMPFEFVLTQSWRIISRDKATGKVNLTYRQMDQGDQAESLKNEMLEAVDKVQSNQISFGESHFTLFIYSNSLDELDDYIGFAEGELGQLGVTSVVENINLEPAFWAQLPSNFSYIARKPYISSFNFAHLVSMHNMPAGLTSNKWGEYISVLTTSDNTPYWFNWHLKDVGITTIVGSTGSGKTVVTLLLIAQSMKHNPTVFIFDKDRGSEIFIRAAGGRYTKIRVGQATGWNPLQLPIEKSDTEATQNRAFLKDLLTYMLTGDHPLDAREKQEVDKLIKLVVELRPQDRKLSNCITYVKGALPDRVNDFSRWITDGLGNVGENAWLFDNKSDHLDLNTGMFGFDMTEFMKIPEIKTPIMMYLFHRIKMAMDGRPTIIDISEFWSTLDNPYFQERMTDEALTIRKKNGVLIMDTQRAEHAIKNADIVEQASTHIFFANPKAKLDQYEAFGLTQRDVDLIKKMEERSGWFLLKRADGSLVARADLTGCDDELAVLSARKETLALMDELIDEFGEDPENWLYEFLRRYKNV
ncbi:VirB4 family type IV secretion/conjugal transfer ATPase [Marinicella sp. W31]|uniref:VirB4 family type IV secretion/conjugal transfer ATPase n=1 Tax=Marinicella sp. W31 TaxID=3023713 RepID=UPI003756C385